MSETPVAQDVAADGASAEAEPMEIDHHVGEDEAATPAVGEQSENPGVEMDGESKVAVAPGGIKEDQVVTVKPDEEENEEAEEEKVRVPTTTEVPAVAHEAGANPAAEASAPAPESAENVGQGEGAAAENSAVNLKSDDEDENQPTAEVIHDPTVMGESKSVGDDPNRPSTASLRRAAASGDNNNYQEEEEEEEVDAVVVVIDNTGEEETDHSATVVKASDENTLGTGGATMPPLRASPEASKTKTNDPMEVDRTGASAGDDTKERNSDSKAASEEKDATAETLMDLKASATVATAVAVCDDPIEKAKHSALTEGRIKHVKRGEVLKRPQDVSTVVTRNGKTWSEMFDYLVAYKEEHGNTYVPDRFKNEEGVCLGLWVRNQRRREGSLTEEQHRRLTELGLDWQTQNERFDNVWHERYAKLTEYRMEHGDCKVPYTYKTDPALAKWVSQQRAQQAQGRLAPDRFAKLNAIDFSWKLNTVKNRNTKTEDKKWMNQYQKLVAFHSEHGHCKVPDRYKPDRPLGTWVKKQRLANACQQLRENRKEMLDNLGFVWRITDKTDGEKWDRMFSKLKQYKEDNGTCHVSRTVPDSELKPLARWVKTQRALYKSGKILPDRRDKLESIDFVWDGTQLPIKRKRRRSTATDVGHVSHKEPLEPEFKKARTDEMTEGTNEEEKVVVCEDSTPPPLATTKPSAIADTNPPPLTSDSKPPPADIQPPAVADTEPPLAVDALPPPPPPPLPPVDTKLPALVDTKPPSAGDTKPSPLTGAKPPPFASTKPPPLTGAKPTLEKKLPAKRVLPINQRADSSARVATTNVKGYDDETVEATTDPQTENYSTSAGKMKEEERTEETSEEKDAEAAINTLAAASSEASGAGLTLTESPVKLAAPKMVMTSTPTRRSKRNLAAAKAATEKPADGGESTEEEDEEDQEHNTHIDVITI